MHAACHGGVFVLPVFVYRALQLELALVKRRVKGTCKAAEANSQVRTVEQLFFFLSSMELMIDL
jgi:hypothetical protein